MSEDLYQPLNNNFNVEEGKQAIADESEDNLVESDDSWEKWSFFRTVAYWVSIMYLEGSTLFVIGAFFSMLNLSSYSEKNEKALVAIPYFVGSIAFTLGGYFGIIEIINMPIAAHNDGHLGTRYSLFFTGRKQWEAMKASGVTFDALAGYMSYFMGAAFFNVNTISSFVLNDMTATEKDIFSWSMAAIGSGLFIIGGCYDCKVTRVFTAPNIGQIGQWLSVFNLIGGIFFTIAAVSGAIQVLSPIELRWWQDFTYLVGSASFAAGAMCSLHMWKDEQFGLALVPTLNKKKPSKDHNSKLKNLEQYGCGKSSLGQLPWLWLYIINASASVMEIAAVVNSENVDHVKVYKSLLNFALSHGILMLGSVIHHVPTAAPHSWLLNYMRIVLLFYTTMTIVGVYQELDHCSQDE